MAGDHAKLSIDKDGNIKVERLNAVRNLTNLLFAVHARVVRVGFQFRDRTISYSQKRSAATA